MTRYTPTINYQRHKAYLCAFDSRININKYFKLIKKFILDKNISCYNDEDIQFLRDLLFDTKFGRNHIYFYQFIYSSINRSKKNFRIFTKYTDFLGAISVYFLEDMFDFVINTKNNNFIKNYFFELSLPNKIKFLKSLKKYPFLLKKIPKIKSYVLFC